MLIKTIKGMKYPDEYVTRFFFKEKLNNKKGGALELGCGNGNNLCLFYEYGWDVTGVDINKVSCLQALKNFNLIKIENNLKNSYNFKNQNMLNFVKNYNGKSYDVLLFPSSIFYLSYNDINMVFAKINENKILKSGGLVFLKILTTQDYRYRRGKQIGPFTYKITIPETGEKNAIITFLHEHEWVELLKKYFNFVKLNVCSLQFNNVQNGYNIFNSDIILWGKII